MHTKRALWQRNNHMEAYATQWKFLENSAKAGRLAHAYLFSGTDKKGTYELALRLVQLVNCMGTKKPCLSCRKCVAIEKLQDPDLTIVEPVEKEDITIEQIRKLISYLSLAAYDSLVKTVIIKDAHCMNHHAQSAFLKLLEEPKGDTLFVLLCDHGELLLQTVRSRTQEIRFVSDPEPAAPELIQELEVMKKSSFTKRFAFAKKIADADESERLLHSWLVQLRKELLLCVDSKRLLYNTELVERIWRALRTTNVNKRLALEQILIEL